MRMFHVTFLSLVVVIFSATAHATPGSCVSLVVGPDKLIAKAELATLWLKKFGFIKEAESIYRLVGVLPVRVTSRIYGIAGRAHEMFAIAPSRTLPGHFSIYLNGEIGEGDLRVLSFKEGRLSLTGMAYAQEYAASGVKVQFKVILEVNEANGDVLIHYRNPGAQIFKVAHGNLRELTLGNLTNQ